MKISMFCSGLPRFGNYFIENLNLIKNENIDLYFYMWESDLKYQKILSLIPDRYTIKKIIQVKEPVYENIVPRSCEDVTLKRIVESCYKQHYGLKNVFNIIDEQYSKYVRFRVDGKLNTEIDLNDYDVNRGIFIPKNNQHSGSNIFEPFNDQFAIGNHDDMKIYCSLYDVLDKWFFEGITPIHQESALKHLLDVNKIRTIVGNFEYYLEKKK